VDEMTNRLKNVGSITLQVYRGSHLGSKEAAFAPGDFKITLGDSGKVHEKILKGKEKSYGVKLVDG